MKRTIVTALITFATTIALFSGTSAPVVIQPATVTAQSANPRSDLVTSLRQDVGKFFDAMQAFKGHRQEKISNNITFVSGDLTGSNATNTFVAADMNQMITDFNTCIDAVQNGGTISVGVWANVLKCK
jgi:hypothetical protein